MKNLYEILKQTVSEIEEHIKKTQPIYEYEEIPEKLMNTYTMVALQTALRFNASKESFIYFYDSLKNKQGSENV